MLNLKYQFRSVSMSLKKRLVPFQQNYSLTFQLKRHQNSHILLLELQHQVTYDIIDFMIDEDSIQKNQILRICQHTPSELYQELIANQQNLRLTNTEELIYFVNILGRNKQRQETANDFCLRMVNNLRQQMIQKFNNQQEINLRNQEIVSKVRSIDKKLFISTKELSYSIESLRKDLGQKIGQKQWIELREGLQKKQPKTDQLLAERLAKIEHQLQQTNKRLQQLKDKSSEVDNRVSQFVKNYEAEKSNQLSKIQSVITSQLYHHPESLHKNRFKVSPSANKLKIEYVHQWDGYYYSFTKYSALSPSSPNIFFLRTVKTSSNGIMIGLATRSIVGSKNAYNDQESIFYDLRDGQLWLGGNHKSAGRQIKEGQLIKLTVNLPNKTISWALGNQLLAQAIIPQVIRSRDSFLTILMVKENDVVQLQSQ